MHDEQSDDLTWWHQAQQHEQQMYEFEMRMQRFRESVEEVMQAEAKANAALREALQTCMREIDKSLNTGDKRESE